MFSPLAAFDGSVVVARTTGEVSARCHDGQANFLALNLMHDVVSGAKSPQASRRGNVHEWSGLPARTNSKLEEDER